MSSQGDEGPPSRKAQESYEGGIMWEYVGNVTDSELQEDHDIFPGK